MQINAETPSAVQNTMIYKEEIARIYDHRFDLFATQAQISASNYTKLIETNFCATYFVFLDEKIALVLRSPISRCGGRFANHSKRPQIPVVIPAAQRQRDDDKIWMFRTLKHLKIKNLQCINQKLRSTP